MTDTIERTAVGSVIRGEVFRKGLEAVTSEMATTLIRTSGSPVVTEANDFCCSVLDHLVEQIAFGGFVAVHIATSVPAVQAVLARYDVDDIRPGDGFLANDPHMAGALHQGDLAVVMPYFYDSQLVAWGFVNEHVLDIGGSAVSGYAPEARDVFAEALRFGGIRAIRDGRLDADWRHFLSDNVRIPQPLLNDIRSMVAAHNTGEGRLARLIDEYGLEDVRSLTAMNKRLTEGMVRSRLADLPDGIYKSEDWIEYDGHGEAQLFNIRLEMTVSGDQVRFMYRGDPQTDSYINGTATVVRGFTMNALLNQLIWDVPVNEGIWRPIEFDLGPEGTVVNAIPPAPVSQSHMQAGMRVSKIAGDVLSQALSLSSNRDLRARAAAQPGNGPCSTTLSGLDRRTGRRTVMFPMSPPHCQGGGAQTVIDGCDTYGSHPTLGTGVPAVEIEENTAPMMVLWRRIAQNSGGAGVRTGGRGISMGISILNTVDGLRGTAFNPVAEVVPRGFGGGKAAGASGFTVITDNNVRSLLASGSLALPERISGRTEAHPSQVGHMSVADFDTFHFRSNGGGGLGDPLLRRPALVAADLSDGYITAGAARDVFGVVIREGSVAEAETVALRRAIREGRLGGPPARESVRTDVGAPIDTELSVGVGCRDGRWICAVCGGDLGPIIENFRVHSIGTERDAVDELAAADMQIRRRPEGQPPVVLRDYFCPSCGYTVVQDVTLADRPVVASPNLGIRS